MQALMRARYKDGRALTDDEVSGILLTALFAGQHTSAVLATWTGLELFRASDYVERVRQEMRDVYGETGTMTSVRLKAQSLMENAVRECERLHPPLIMLIRKVLRPMRYRDMTIPAGTLAMVSPAVSHRLPDIFARPRPFQSRSLCPACIRGQAASVCR